MQKFSEGGDRYQNPLIVQSDRTILLDVHAPLADECRNALIPFAELERSPEHLHTYRLTPLSLWNATSAGIKSDSILETLDAYSRYDVPQNVGAWIKETAERFGKLTLVPAPSQENAQNAASVSGADDTAATALSFGAFALISFMPVHIFGTVVFFGLVAAWGSSRLLGGE